MQSFIVVKHGAETLRLEIPLDSDGKTRWDIVDQFQNMSRVMYVVKPGQKWLMFEREQGLFWVTPDLPPFKVVEVTKEDLTEGR